MMIQERQGSGKVLLKSVRYAESDERARISELIKEVCSLSARHRAQFWKKVIRNTVIRTNGVVILKDDAQIDGNVPDLPVANTVIQKYPHVILSDRVS